MMTNSNKTKLWDKLIKERLATAKDMDRDIRLVLMVLQNIDGRISDLEEDINDMRDNIFS